MGAILALIDRINALIARLVGIALGVIVVAIAIQILVRFVLTAVGINISAPWTEELARFVLVWVIFLGAAVGCRRAQLIALEFVVRALAPLPGQALRYATMSLCIAFFALLIWVSLPFVEMGATETSPVMQIPKHWVYWAMPVGAALMIVNTLALMAEACSTGRDIRLIGGPEARE